MPFSLFAPNVPNPERLDLTPPEVSTPSFQQQSPWFVTNQPTRQGALEFDPMFRKAADRAWMSIGAGTHQAESGFWVGQNGQPGPVSVWLDQDHHNSPGAKIPMLPDAMALYHTHPNTATMPSDVDVNSAKQLRRTIYVGSKGGLYAIDPSGQVTHVFSDPSWMTSKNPR